MDLVSRTLFLCLAFALTRAGPLQDSAAGDGKPPKCSDVKLGAITTDNAKTTYIFADIMGRHCEHDRKRVEARGRLMGAYLPQCDDNGQYLPDQHHGSTGYHWCADSKGQKIPGTDTPPGVPNVNCSKPDEPQRLCQRHKDELKGIDTSVGVFVPECDENGEYQPKQCHASTGECRCVDKRGIKKSGTETQAGSPPPDCSKAVERHYERQRPLLEADGSIFDIISSVCKKSGQIIPPEIHGMVAHCRCGRKKRAIGPVGFGCSAGGAFYYEPQQCHNATGHCWCVNNMGRERPGTRTPPGTQPVDCDKESRFYMRLDTVRDGLHSLPITRTWQEVGDRVDAAFIYSDKMYLIKGEQVYIYLVDSNFTLIGDRPQSLKSELGIEGPVDAAFHCFNSHLVHIIQGNRMRDVNLIATPRFIMKDRTLPLSDIDAGLCDSDGVKLFKGSDYYHFRNVELLAKAKIAPEPKKITSAMLGCED